MRRLKYSCSGRGMALVAWLCDQDLPHPPLVPMPKA